MDKVTALMHQAINSPGRQKHYRQRALIHEAEHIESQRPLQLPGPNGLVAGDIYFAGLIIPLKHAITALSTRLDGK